MKDTSAIKSFLKNILNIWSVKIADYLKLAYHWIIIYFLIFNHFYCEYCTHTKNVQSMNSFVITEQSPLYLSKADCSKGYPRDENRCLTF